MYLVWTLLAPNQVAMILAAAVAAIIGIKNGLTWQEIESGMIDTIKMSLQAIFDFVNGRFIDWSMDPLRHSAQYDFTTA